VSSLIDVAWIGVAGVVIGGFISITGTAVNGWTARRAAEMTLEGEHRQRLWEKQSAAYEETVREVLARQTRREALTSRGDVGSIGSHPIEEMRKHEEPESIRIKALLLAYASAAVWAAYDEADSANALFWLNLSRLASAQLATQSRAEQQSVGVSEGSLRPEVDYRGALDAMHNSKKDAVTVDKALFDAINRELSWTPQPIPVSTGLAGLRVFRRS
jgi:hypothetical protein